jgi:hypothetical protein
VQAIDRTNCATHALLATTLRGLCCLACDFSSSSFPYLPPSPTLPRSADPGTKSHLIYRFVDPREAEILVRCCRSWSPLDPELVEPQGVELAERIIKVHRGGGWCGGEKRRCQEIGKDGHGNDAGSYIAEDGQ